MQGDEMREREWTESRIKTLERENTALREQLAESMEECIALRRQIDGPEVYHLKGTP